MCMQAPTEVLDPPGAEVTGCGKSPAVGAGNEWNLNPLDPQEVLLACAIHLSSPKQFVLTGSF